jgi:murein L,D-transpeptidase YafK
MNKQPMKSLKYLLYLLLFALAGLAVYYVYPEKKLPEQAKADRIVVLKSKRQLQLYEKDKLLKTYTISLGRNPVGHKKYEGDNKTPEGRYSISKRGTHDVYHKYLYISYPNHNDVLDAAIAGKDPGGAILIHGANKKYSFLNKLHRWKDWTRGCIAVTNEEIDELYQAVVVGTIIDIKP